MRVAPTQAFRPWPLFRALVRRLTIPEYDAVVQRAVIVTVEAYDWNCQQHITPRFTGSELEPLLAGARQRILDLEAENADLKSRLGRPG